MNNELLEYFKETEALLSGHFLLTSGKHSDQYFQCAKVLQHPRYAEKFCTILADAFRDQNIETVIAPAVGGIVVGQEVARLLGARSIFSERENGAMVLRRGFTLQPGERVLVCEDVVTTGGSVFEVIDIVKQAGAIPCGVGYIVDRSNGKVDFGIAQKATVSLSVVAYEKDDCPMCKSGSIPYKPGSRSIK